MNITKNRSLLQEKLKELEGLLGYKIPLTTDFELTVCSKCLEEGTTNDICRHSWEVPRVTIPYTVCNCCDRTSLDLNPKEMREDYNTFLKYYSCFPLNIRREMVTELNSLKKLRPLEDEDNKEEVLSTYRQGFNDELEGKDRTIYKDTILNKAYKLGREYAELGDEVKSFDFMSEEQILNIIYDKK